jgi:hypothetical protein
MLTQLKTKLDTSLETYLTRNNTKNKQKWLTSGLTKIGPECFDRDENENENFKSRLI